MFRLNDRIKLRKIRKGIISFHVFFLVIWSNRLDAQPPANPIVVRFGNDNKWLTIFIILVFTCSLIYGLLSGVGNYLSDKTHKPFWKKFWGVYFVIIGLITWIFIAVEFFLT